MKVKYIYRITNLINGKIYIGQTICLSKRWYDHRRTSRASVKRQAISFAIAKYGESNFIFEPICACLSYEEADRVEIDMIATYNSTDRSIGYNIHKGGKGVANHNPHRRATPGSFKKGHPPYKGCFVKGQAATTGSFQKGHMHSDETKKKISITLAGRPGRKISDWEKERISKANKGNQHGRRYTFELAQQIREDRKQNKLTIKQLISKYGVPKNTLIEMLMMRTYLY